jgi:hypothetical protein
MLIEVAVGISREGAPSVCRPGRPAYLYVAGPQGSRSRPVSTLKLGAGEASAMLRVGSERS